MKNLVLSCILLLTACSEKMNINQFIISKEQKNAVDVLIAQARFSYDKGDFDAAADYADRAYEINPSNEEVAVISGFVYLALAGIDAFNLAKRMIEMNETKSTALNGNDFAADGNTVGEKLTATTASSDNAGDTMTKLVTVLGLDSSKFEGTLGDKSTSTVAMFADLPIIKPYCAGDARQKLSNLLYVNKAISRICPFVSDGTRLATDVRHACTPTTNRHSFQSKSNFLWSFSHLTEALAFYAVFSYSTQADESPNLTARADAISNDKPTDLAGISSFVTAVKDFQESVETILPVSGGTCNTTDNPTQLTAMLNDLKATAAGFANLPGIPTSMTKSIVDSINKITEFSKTKVDQSSAESGALKGQLTKQLASQLGTKITELESEYKDQITPDQLATMCTSYGSIAGEDSGLTKPTGC